MKVLVCGAAGVVWIKDVANIGGWLENTVAVKEKGKKHKGCDVEVLVESTQSSMSFLGSCLVGRLEEGVTDLPSAMEIQRLAQRNWKVTAGVQASELGGACFLFTLSLVEEAQRVLRGRWSFGDRRVELEWWSPTGCCVKKGEVAAEVWVRVLGLPLHLWILRCSERLEISVVDDETKKRTHFCWARIAVTAAPAKIPASVKVAMGGWLFELPLWVEKGPKVVFQLVFRWTGEGMEDVTGLHVVVRRGEEGGG